MEPQNPKREQFIFKVDNQQIDVLPLLRLVSNEGAASIASTIDTFMFMYLSQKHDAEPDYLPDLVYILKEIRDAFLRIGQGTELYFYVANDNIKEVESKLYWSILKA